MILISLLLYLVIVAALYLTGATYLFKFTWYYFAIVFVICMVLVRVSFSVIRNFQNELIPGIIEISKIPGTRKAIFMTAAISFTMVYFLATSNMGGLWSAFLVPVAVVSTLHFLSIEFLPAYLYNDSPDTNWMLPADLSASNGNESSKVIPGESNDNEPVEEPPKLVFKKRYNWNHKGKTHTTNLDIRPAVYQKFKELKRVDYDLWSEEYVANGLCGEVRSLSGQLMQVGKPENSYEEVEFVLAFTQEIVKYELDADYYPNAIADGEYPKYPVETLTEETGDCEDSAILAASLLKSMGYDCALIYLPGHCALGIAGVDGLPGTSVKLDNVSYYYCETTASGWEVGTLPSDYNDSDLKILPVPSVKINLEL